MLRKIVCLSSLVLGLAVYAPMASAHTMSMGELNSSPGSLTIWLGSYHTGAANQGTATLTGLTPVVYGPVTQSFNLLSSTLPTGLVLGTNYFYTSQSGGLFTSTTTPINPTQWQGVTFTGLVAGSYNLVVSGMTSANWAYYSNGQTSWSKTVTLQQGVNVPEPTTLALLGLGFAALGFTRRRQSSVN